MAKYKIGIIGLGLIGASILKGLSKNKDFELFCSSKSSYDKALKYTKNSSNKMDIVKNCDLVFVCSEISQTLNTLNELNLILDKNTIVVDVTSIKKDLLGKKFNFEFILSHPMAGTEFSGFDAGRDDLFFKAKWLIEKNNPLLEFVIKSLEAQVCVVDMKTHDNLACQISHLPTILSFLLFNNASFEAKQIASSGFRDMTRLAQTSSNLALSMFNNNLDNIEKNLKNLQKNFDYLKTLSDKEKLEIFSELSKNRGRMYDKDGKNIFNI